MNSNRTFVNDDMFINFTVALKGAKGGVDYADSRNTWASNAAYLDSNPDVRATWKDSAWSHYILYGQKEGRSWVTIPDAQVSDESEQDYFTRYPDVAAKWKTYPAYAHYLFYGRNEGRSWNSSATAPTNIGVGIGAGTATGTVSAPPTGGGAGGGIIGTIKNVVKDVVGGVVKVGDTKTDDTGSTPTPNVKPKWVTPVIIGGAVLVIGTIVYFAMRKK
jgi:hypothetical protein